MRTGRVWLVFLFIIFYFFGALNAEDLQKKYSELAFDLLKNGNARFAADESVHPNASLERRYDNASNGQHPCATILACSDSRLPLEILFDAGIGDLFSVRVAGNVIDRDELASIEYGVEHLGTPLLIVLGHTSCGAVGAAIQEVEAYGNIPFLLNKITPTVKRLKKSGLTGSALADKAIKENAFNSAKTILLQSEIVKERIAHHQLKMVVGIYHLESGSIEWLGAHPDESSLISHPSSGETKTGILKSLLWGSALALLLFLMLRLSFQLFVAENRVFKTLKFSWRFSLTIVAFLFSSFLIEIVIFYLFQNQFFNRESLQNGQRNHNINIIDIICLTLPLVFVVALMVQVFTNAFNKSLQAYFAYFKAAVLKAERRAQAEKASGEKSDS